MPHCKISLPSRSLAAIRTFSPLVMRIARRKAMAATPAGSLKPSGFTIPITSSALPFRCQSVRQWPVCLDQRLGAKNHYLLVFSPSGFEEFLRLTAVPAPENAPAPTKPPAIPVHNVHELATDVGIRFDGDAPPKAGKSVKSMGPTRENEMPEIQRIAGS